LQTELQRLRDHLESLERRLGGTQQQAIEAADGVKQIQATFRQFRAADDGFSQLNTFQAWRDHATTSLKDLLADVEKLDKALAQLQTQTSGDKESADSQFRDLDGKIKNNSNKLEKLGSGHQTHGEQLKRSEMTIGRLQRGLEALGEQSDLLHADQLNLRTAHNDAVNKQEVHRIALAKTQADLQHATKELHSAGNQMHVLKDGLAETNLSMTKLGGRYDSCTRNIMGMTKGLQDISKSVGQGEHGLLPPKSVRRLPEINSATVRNSRDPSPVRSAFAMDRPSSRLQYGTDRPSSRLQHGGTPCNTSIAMPQ
jgi:chromosome segregation ATPase